MKISRISTALCLITALFTSFAVNTSVRADDADPSLTQTVTDEEKVAPEGEKVVLEAGHVDMGPRLINNTWELMMRDDTSGTPVWRHIDDVVLRVKDQAKMMVPQTGDYSFIGADHVWVVPQTEVTKVPWLGWNTQSPSVKESINGGVTLTYSGHQGEGLFSLFLQSGNFGAPHILVNPSVNTSQSFFVEPNTHTHANWAFTSPGVHLIKISASATLTDGTKVNDTKILRFAVGEEFSSSDEKTGIEEEASTAQWRFTNDPGDAQVSAEPRDTNNSGLGIRWVLVAAALVSIVVVSVVGYSAYRRTSLRREALGEKEQ